MKQSKLLGVLSVALILTSSMSYAGGWVSGGGELLSDAQNPWWVKNTTEVRYCVEMDAANFGVGEARARHLISRAFRFWKNQFSKVTYADFAGEHGGIATQAFIETDCDSSVDLKFQLGTLSAEQIEKISDIGRFIGLSVRTAYDSARLHGRGFIYIAPQSGPLRPTSDRLLPAYWSRDSHMRFYLTLVHELGHVFGLPHMSDFAMMDEGFPDLAASNPGNGWALMGAIFDKQVLFKFSLIHSEQMSFCFADREIPVPIPGEPIGKRQKVFGELDLASSSDVVREFLGFEEHRGCIQPVVARNHLEFRFTGEGEQVRRLGRTTIHMEPPQLLTKLVGLYLTKSGRKIFPNADLSTPMQRFAFYEAEAKGKGEYLSEDGKIQRQTMLRWAGGRFVEIGGVLDGKPYFDILKGF